MTDKVLGLESAAARIITRAVKLDTNRRFLEALSCYGEGIGILMDVIKETPDKSRKESIRKRLDEYMTRGERIKVIIERERNSGKYHEQITIAANAVGFGYENIFKYLIDDTLTEVEIDDPYIRKFHQIQNLVRVCEVLVQNATGLKRILVVTGREQNSEIDIQQDKAFHDLGQSLSEHGVNLTVKFDIHLHDREIRFNNGWIVKIGRGLDIFKPPANKFSLGTFDCNLRQCHATTIDIFHQKHVAGN